MIPGGSLALARLSVVVDVLCRELPPSHVGWGVQAAKAVLVLQQRFVRPIRPTPVPFAVDLDQVLLDLVTVEACLERRSARDGHVQHVVEDLEVALQHLTRACRSPAGLCEA